MMRERVSGTERVTQTEFIKAGGLIRAEERGRTGTEKFPNAQSQSADNHLGDAGGIVARLAGLRFAGLIHIHATPNPHACACGKAGHGNALGHPFGAVGHVVANVAKGHSGMSKFRRKKPHSSGAQARHGHAHRGN